MFSKIFTAVTALVLVSGITFGGNLVKVKAPHLVGVDEPARVVDRDGSLPPMVSALGPGDSIGYGYYDYGTNGSCRQGLINYGDGTFSFASMGSLDGSVTGWASRGSYYKYYDGLSWQTNWDQVEATRRGWTAIAQIADAGGVEVIMSHVGMECNVDAAKGADTWSSTLTGGDAAGQLWPRVAIGNGFTIHVVYSNANPPSAIWYAQSPDAGASWPTVDMQLYTHPNDIGDADAYSITAQGDKVAILIAGAGLAGTGGDVVLLESMDAGANWTETLLYDVDESGLTAGEEPADGSCDVIYDFNGNLHAAWGSYLYDGTGATFLSQGAGIRHWSAATGVQEVAFADADTTIVSHGGTDGNYITTPDLAADDEGNVFLTYMRFINEQDDSSNYLQHIFGKGSGDGGATWSDEVDLTPGSGFDGVFQMVAEHVDDYIHFVYYCDALAGNVLNGPQTADAQVAFMYHMVDKLTLLTGVKEVPDVVPSAYRLEQNYPNPFNPTTNIRYSIPQSSFVTLTVFDMVGREVATLVNQEQSAGTYVADFDATNLANGTYFYKIQAGSFSETHKMMVLK
jgi:hypothetical protein